MDKKQKYVKMGYTFSGVYSSDKNEVKKRKKELAKENKVVIIPEKSLARYTTGAGGKVYNVGYSLYIKPKHALSNSLNRI